jgi:choline dehydrogenase-like flavoprotein
VWNLVRGQYLDIDPQMKDSYGIPAARIHFQWGQNELEMWEQSKQVCGEVLRAAGGYWNIQGKSPRAPVTACMKPVPAAWGNDPRRFITNRFGQTHDVANLYVCDASVFLNCTDKSTTLSILAFSLRTSEYIVQQFRRGDH